MIADEAQEGVDGYFTSPYNVLKDSPIQKIEDLKGKIIASVGPGAAVDIAMRAMLKRAGLEDKRDYTVVEAGFPNMRAMLADKKADLITSVLPFAGDPELLKIARPLFTVRDALQGPSQFVVWAAREPSCRRTRTSMNDLMEDSARALHFYMDPEEPRAVPGSSLAGEQATAIRIRVRLHQERSLPRSELPTQSRVVATRSRCHARARIAQGEDGRHEICGSELCRRGRAAAQVRRRVVAMM